MWIVIGAIVLFIIYLVIKKQSEKAAADEAEMNSAATSAMEQASPMQEPVKKEAAPKEAAPKETPAPKKPMAEKAAPASSSLFDEDESEYSTQFKSLSANKSESKEFTLFDTKAAFFWNKGDSTVDLLSITAFVKGAAKSDSYGTYSFNVQDWTWDGDQPKGCATEIKKYLSENFTKGETA